MNIRSFDAKLDYVDVYSWWKKQEWPVLPLEMLPPNGFIVENTTNKIAATWIFKLECPIYLIEWTVGNPELNWEDRSKGIELILNEACNWAKVNGATHILTMTKNERFMNKLENFGFKKTDLGMTHLVRVL